MRSQLLEAPEVEDERDQYQRGRVHAVALPLHRVGHGDRAHCFLVNTRRTRSVRVYTTVRVHRPPRSKMRSGGARTDGPRAPTRPLESGFGHEQLAHPAPGTPTSVLRGGPPSPLTDLLEEEGLRGPQIRVQGVRPGIVRLTGIIGSDEDAHDEARSARYSVRRCRCGQCGRHRRDHPRNRRKLLARCSG